MTQLKTKRIYEPYAEEDGFRVLIDRLWPRGISKAAARIDLWLKEVAPSTELRQWFHQQTDQWTAFKDRYFAELDANPRQLQPLFTALQRGDVTLLYARRDDQHNHATALVDYITNRHLPDDM